MSYLTQEERETLQLNVQKLILAAEHYTAASPALARFLM